MFKLIIFLLLSCSHHSIKKTPLANFSSNFSKKNYEDYSNEIMISTQGKHSTQAGLDVIKSGGNIVDAAVAISFAISVERPQSTGLGGGGFMLLDGPLIKKTKILDFREIAPLKANEKMYLDENEQVVKGLSLNGALSVAVPGFVRGVLEIHRKYGKLSLSKVLTPAISLAENGFKVYPHLAKSLSSRRKVLEKYPETRKIFFKKENPLKVGDHLYQKDLAKTLRLIAEKSDNGFYKGRVGNSIVETVNRYGGIFSQEDLDRYHTRSREPVRGKYKDYEVLSMPPPSSGGVHILQILNILENDDLKKLGFNHSDVIHLKSMAMKLAFIDRAKFLGDPDFVFVPTKKLISKKYAKALRGLIHMNSEEIRKSSKNLLPKESDDTTHFSIMDKWGNAISSTQTINYLFGSGIVAKGTGVVLNDEMDDFSSQPGDSNVFGAVGSYKNRVEPRKRPLSSMSPTLIKKNGKPVLVLGTPSGTRILTCVSNVILNYLEHDMSLFDSVAAIRFHHQWSPNVIRVDEPGFSKDVVEALENKGHKVINKNLGCKIQAVSNEGGKLHGVSDPRGEGSAKGI